MMRGHSPLVPDARRDRLTDTDADLYRDGRRAHRLAARRPDRHRAARGHYAAGERRDDARRFRLGGEPADPGAAVRDDDHLGAIRRIRLYRPLRAHDYRHARRHGGAAGADRRDRRRFVGGTRQRYPDHHDRAAAGRRSAASRSRSAAVRDRAGRRDECGFRGDADRQSAKHIAGRDRPPRLLAFSRDQWAAGIVLAGQRVRGGLAAMEPAHAPAGGRAGRRATMPRRRCRRTRSTGSR